MNDALWVVIGAMTVLTCAALWGIVTELFRRCFSNDWCSHDWGMWENRRDEWSQQRFCKKCNMMERRVP